MIKSKYTYSDKEFLIAPYKTSQEKDLLLLSTIADNDLDAALLICKVQQEIIDSLTEDEKLAMLYKLRAISIGSEIQVKFTCTNCKSPNDNTIDIDDIITDSNITNSLIKDCYKRPVNVQEFINTDVSDMNYDEYESLLQEVKDTCTKFNFRRSTTCQKCTETNYIDISDIEFCIDCTSEDSLISLYQCYNDLTFFGKYTKLDVDSLYPFERTILIGLLNKTREDLNK